MSIVSKQDLTSLDHANIERLVQKGRGLRSQAFRGALNGLVSGAGASQPRDIELQAATARS